MAIVATSPCGPRPLEAASLSSPSGARKRAPRIVPASDHSAWTVPLVSIDPASSDQRDRSTRERSPLASSPSGQSLRLAPTGLTGTPNDRRTLRGFLSLRARSSVRRGARRVVIITSRHALHSSALLARRSAVLAISDRASHVLRLGGTMRVQIVRIVPPLNGRFVLRTERQASS